MATPCVARLMEPVILINRGGGSVGDDAQDRATAALAKAGIAGKVELLPGDELAERAKAAVAGGANLVIAGGGDGTMSSVAAELAGSDTALGILPMGTLNHLARDLDIPFDLDQAAAIIAANQRRTIDLAEVNGRIFVNNSAVGLYPLLVDTREAGQRRWGWSKSRAMAAAAVRTLARFHHHRLHLSSGDKSATIDTPLLFVGNNDYSVALPSAGQRGSLSDGKLCVMVLRKTGRWGLVAVIARALVGRSRGQDMIRADAIAELRVDSRASQLSVALDGETWRIAPPLTYRIRPAALRVIAP